MNTQELQKLIDLERLTIEQKVEGDELLRLLAEELGLKEVYVQEPDDIDDEVIQIWTEAALNKLREAAVVAIANGLGIDASTRDLKADTIQKILDHQSG